MWDLWLFSSRRKASFWDCIKSVHLVILLKPANFTFSFNGGTHESTIYVSSVFQRKSLNLVLWINLIWSGTPQAISKWRKNYFCLYYWGNHKSENLDLKKKSILIIFQIFSFSAVVFKIIAFLRYDLHTVNHCFKVCSSVIWVH